MAAAEGIELPADLPDRALGFADALEPGGGSSLHHDLVHGRRMELDTVLGEFIRRGERRGVEVPTSRAMYGVLQPLAARATIPNRTDDQVQAIRARRDPLTSSTDTPAQHQPST